MARHRDGANLALRVDRTGKVDHLEPLPRAKLPTTGWRIARTARGGIACEDLAQLHHAQARANGSGEAHEIARLGERLRLPLDHGATRARAPNGAFRRVTVAMTVTLRPSGSVIAG